MKVTYKINGYKNMEATLTMTMTLEEWDKVKIAIDQTKDYHHDAQLFANMISRVLDKGATVFEEHEEG